MAGSPVVSSLVVYRSIQINSASWKVKTNSVTSQVSKKSNADWTTSSFQFRQGPRPCAESILAQGLRGHFAPRSDQGHGHQPPQPLLRLRQQGGAVPQGDRPLHG